jgi:hypothetical protein
MNYDAIVGGATMAIFSLAIVALLKVTLRDADFGQALIEKNGPTAPAPAAVPPAAASVGGAAAVAPAATNGSAGVTSYSRVAGMTGATVLACFLWALGNVILYKCFHDPHAAAEVSTLVSGIAPYFLVGSAMFLPYAFNQIKAVFN